MKSLSNWTLMASHGVVLFYIALKPEATMRQMSFALGLTERSVVRIVHELSEAGYIEVHRSGSRNVYCVNTEATFQGPAMSQVSVSDFVRLLSKDGDHCESPSRV
jgi:DNA-binding IclR family transcriptional regulator